MVSLVQEELSGLQEHFFGTYTSQSLGGALTPTLTVKLTTRNALFAGLDDGAGAMGRFASLIEIGKMNHGEPHAWLRATAEAIAAGHPNRRID